MVTRPPMEQEPTEDFNKRCTEVLRHWQQGDIRHEDASEQLRTLKQEAVKMGHLANEARAELVMGVIAGYRANLALGLRHFERARELFEQVGNERRVNTCVLNLGELYRQKGDFLRAQRHFDQAYEGAKKLNIPRTQTIALSNKGQALLSMNRLDDAQKCLEEALELYKSLGDEIVELLIEIHHGLATIYLRTNRPTDAWEQAKISLQLALRDGKPMQRGFAYRTMAEVLTILGTTPAEDHEAFPLDIDSYFHEAFTAFNEIDAEGEVARTTFAQARSLSNRGRRVQAARRLQEATIAFSKLGMVDDATKAAELQAEIF